MGTLVNLLIGRLPFALGLALGLCALLALRRGHYPLAVGLAAATMLGSPVAGAFLALAMAAWTLDDISGRLWRGVGLAVACFAPYLLLMRLFPSGGWFPYHAKSFVIGVGISLLLIALVPKNYRAIRIASALHIVAAIATMMVQTPMGGNINRLTMFFAGPILAAVMPVDRRKLLLLVVVPLLHWQWSPSIDAVVDAPTDPTRTAEYYAPLVNVLDDLYADQGAVRVEIVPTLRHWEVAEVAPEIPIGAAGGASSTWSTTRCSTTGRSTPPPIAVAPPRGGVVYRGSTQRAGRRRRRRGGTDRRRAPYLELDRTLTDWTVYEVIHPQPIVAGPGTLLEYGVDDLVIRVDEPGTLHVAVRASPHWKLTGNAGCLAESDNGFVDITGVEPGLLHLAIHVEFSALWDGSTDGCASEV